MEKHSIAAPAELEDKRATWRKIFRGEQAFGEGTPSEQAARFHRAELSKEVIRAAIQGSPKPARKVDLLVSLSGFSPMTTIIAYEVLRPRRLLVISSSSARGGIDEIGEHVVGAGKMAFRDFTHAECDPVDPLSIFDIVRREAGSWEDERPYQVIDITGGKKVMSATAVLAASQLDLAFCYIDSVFDPELRQPVPGTERLVLYETPAAIFEARELGTIQELFNNGGFEEAEARANRLSDRMEHPREARLLRDLAGMYLSWRNLNFGAALLRAKALTSVDTTDRVLTERVMSSIKRQEDASLKGWPLATAERFF